MKLSLLPHFRRDWTLLGLFALLAFSLVGCTLLLKPVASLVMLAIGLLMGAYLASYLLWPNLR